jgi:hypothetical protein
MSSRSPLQEVIEALSAHKFVEAARDFESQVAKLADPDAATRAEAVRAIGDRCQPRWLGDLYVEGLSLQNWWGLLEEASRFAKETAAKNNKAPTPKGPHRG